MTMISICFKSQSSNFRYVSSSHSSWVTILQPNPHIETCQNEGPSQTPQTSPSLFGRPNFETYPHTYLHDLNSHYFEPSFMKNRHGMGLAALMILPPMWISPRQWLLGSMPFWCPEMLHPKFMIGKVQSLFFHFVRKTGQQSKPLHCDLRISVCDSKKRILLHTCPISLSANISTSLVHKLHECSPFISYQF